MFDILEDLSYETQLKIFVKDQDDTVYRRFEDYTKHFLTLIGYKNLEYDQTTKFSEKQTIMRVSIKKEVFKMSGIKDDSPVYYCFENPIFQYWYFAVLFELLMIYGKYFYTNKSKYELQQIYNEYLKQNKMNLINPPDCMAEETYKFIEPFLVKPKSLIYSRKESNDTRYKCNYCGTRYDYNSHNNCPSCGA